MPEFTDEYFINLTMDYDKRDDTIYPKWAVWCAQSNDRYYIDGKDGHFYTHVRTEEEIRQEQRKRELLEYLEQEHSEEDEEKWSEYTRYIFGLMEKISDEPVISFEEWKNK